MESTQPTEQKHIQGGGGGGTDGTVPENKWANQAGMG
jgi:hypothetical protein